MSTSAIVPLRIADDTLEQLKALVLRSVISEHTRSAYGRALQDFLAWYQYAYLYQEPHAKGFTRAAVQAYRNHLLETQVSRSTINLRLSAVKKLADEGEAHGLLDASTASGVLRVHGVPRRGVRAGNWLTLAQVNALMDLPDRCSAVGRRDLALLAVLIGCGLRREELRTLRWEDIQMRDSRWVILDITGKQGRVRTVPMPVWCKQCLDLWAQSVPAPASGIIFVGLTRFGRVRRSILTPQGVWARVRQYGKAIGVPRLAPHDLRRTFAKLARKGAAELDQIQFSLGHSNVTTTQRYIGDLQDLADAPCDRLGVRVRL